MVPKDGRIEKAARDVEEFGAGSVLADRIAQIEEVLADKDLDEIDAVLSSYNADAKLLESAFEIKALSGQINVLIHAVGILAALPFILTEGERIENLSLGAGNTGRAHDLETTARIAEFKFIEWRGGPESIRQNNVFQDVFNLASAETDKRRQLFVLGTEQPLRFLGNSRALSSVLSRNARVASRFRDMHGDAFETVNEYWQTVKDRVELVDLRKVVPALNLDGPT